MPKKKAASLVELLDRYGSSDGAQRDFISTGSIILDQILGGGYPKGSLIEIGGDPGVGKSTLVLSSFKYLCDQGHKCAYIDVEGGVNKSQLDGVGLSQYFGSQFFLFQKNVKTFRDAEEILDALAEDGSFTAIVIDSDTSLSPSDLYEKSVEEVRPGVHAQLAASFLNKYKRMAVDKNLILIVISQVRVKLNFRGVSTTEVSGGNGKKHLCDVRIRMKPASKIVAYKNILGEKKEVQIGVDADVWTTKNRLAPAFIHAPIRIIFGRGFHNAASLAIWLRSHNDENGEPYLTSSSNGRSVLKINGETYKFASGRELEEWVVNHVPEILSLIQQRGGFSLVQEDEDMMSVATVEDGDELEGED